MFGVQNNLSPNSSTLTQNASAASTGQQQFKPRENMGVTGLRCLLPPFLQWLECSYWQRFFHCPLLVWSRVVWGDTEEHFLSFAYAGMATSPYVSARNLLTREALAHMSFPQCPKWEQIPEMVCSPGLLYVGTLLSSISFILGFLHCSIWDEEHFSEQHHG